MLVYWDVSFVLGRRFDIPPSNCIYIYLWFLPLHWYNTCILPHMAHRVHTTPYWLLIDTLLQYALQWNIKSLTASLTELMRVSDYEVLVASVRRSYSSCGKSKRKACVCKLHPQGQRWQTTSQDQTEPTVKHNHRCFSLINTPSPLVISLKCVLDSFKSDLMMLRV